MKPMKTYPCQIIGLLAALAASEARPAETPPGLPLASPKVKTVAVFKNGLGFVTKVGETRLQDGWALLDPLPAAALGALWIGTTDPKHPVTEVVSFKERVVETREALSTAELLAANVGKRVKATFTVAGTTKTVEGIVLSVPAERKPGDDAPPAPPVSSAGGWAPAAGPKPGEIVLLRVMAEDRPTILSLPKAAILALELPADAPLQTSTEKEVARGKVRVGGNPPTAGMVLNYLEKGLVWSPAYRVDIASEKMAGLVLEATLMNDVEMLDEVEVDFVVGYPNFSHAEVANPLGLQQSVAGFIQALMADRRSDAGGRFANVMSQSLLFNSISPETAARTENAYGLPEALPGEASEDLYFYRRPGVTLKKGERGRYELLRVSAPYEHLYQWEIPDSMQVDDRGYRQDPGRRPEPESHVWHVLRLENTGQQPWTTAPAFTMNGLLPLAQDVLNYTPPKARSLLKLTVATDLRAEQSQSEISRKAQTIEGRSFEEVVVSGKLKVTSHKAREAAMVIRKSIVGEVLRADQDGAVSKVVRKLTSVNPTSEIKWEFSLPAGGARELAYQYRTLVYR